MATTKPNTNRRRERRANEPLLRRLRALTQRRGVGWATAYIACFGVVAAFLAVAGRERPAAQLDALALQPIVSRVAFQVEDEDQTIANRQRAADAVIPAFKPNEPYLTALRDRIRGLQAFIAHDSLESIPVSALQGVGLTQDALNDLHEYRQLADPGLAWTRDTQRFFESLLDVVVVRDRDHDDIITPLGWHVSDHAADSLGLRRPPTDTTRYRLQADRAALSERIDNLASANFSPALASMIVAMIDASLQPTYLIDRETLTAAQDAARIDPAHSAWQSIRAGTTLVAPGDRITEEQMRRLALERETFAAARSSGWLWLGRLGVLALTLIMGLGLWAYLYRYRPRIIENPMRGGALLVTLLATLAVAVKTTGADPTYLFVSATLPTLLVAMIFAVVYDQRTALAMSVMHALLVTFALRLPAGFALMIIAGVGVTVALLPDVRTRSHLLRVGLAAGLALAVTALAVGSTSLPIHLDAVRAFLGKSTLLALASGVGAGMIVQALITIEVLERMFRVTTALTLKDLNDAGHPLLQRLAHEAPGTYQHSLRIADIAEAAAESIGADGLLCRVGAMYHDIGKVNKPQYFIENQGGGPNRHDKLSPAMSLLIIVGHVKDGIEMAKDAKLPQQIRHFIESHHGTTLVEYFYHAAKSKNDPDLKGEVDEFQFRYPGPKPQTREAGIMLLCDSIEAAARALPEPTPVRLEQLVKSIAKKRLMDGQFDDCALTLKDLSRIEASITRTLCAVYHGRIKYPDGKPDPKPADDSQIITAASDDSHAPAPGAKSA